MDEAQQSQVDRIVDFWNKAYQNYILIERLPDNPLVRMGYYVAAQLLVSYDPVGDAEIQAGVMQELENIKLEAQKNCLEKIEFSFLEVTRTHAV